SGRGWEYPATIRGEGDEQRVVVFLVVRQATAIIIFRLHTALGPFGPNDRVRDPVPHNQNHPSFLASNSFTICGLAWPLEAFMTCPTKKPSIVFFPARYCSSCFGLAARISSIIFSN